MSDPSRREFLRVGGGSLLGFGLADLLKADSLLRVPRAAPGFGRAKSVVLIFLQGGPSHIDLFDPNGAPRVAEVQTDTQGRFRAVFDLRWAPTLEANRKKWKRARRIVRGTYRARARVCAASEATSDVTPWVYVTR